MISRVTSTSEENYENLSVEYFELGGSHIDLICVYVPAFRCFFVRFGKAIRDKGAQIKKLGVF